MNTSERLGIKKGITSITGSGGKTTLIAGLADELSLCGTVIVMTTTKIYEPHGMIFVSEDDGPHPDEVSRLLMKSRVVCVGTHVTTPSGEIKVGPPASTASELASLADYVLVEADGSKHLPMKAHADNEPVIPAGSGLTVRVVGISGIGKRISEAAHRPEIFAGIAGADISDEITPEAAARVINSERMCDKIYISQVMTEDDMAAAVHLEKLLDFPVIISDNQRREHGF